MKKLLMLGGSLYQTYAIKEAKRLGYYVITCDYLPDNPGHKYADEYHNVSTTDKDAVLKLAKELNVDGIVAYASDPAAPTAAFVCEQLGLPTSPYKSVEILSNKDRFRDFLQKNGFNCPKAMGFTTYEDALAHIDEFHLPVMVKPVDSSGSKGINKMTYKSQLKSFVEDALSYSRSKRFLIEEFIVKKGHQISGDAFSVDGKLVFHCLGNEFYDPNCDKDFAPLGECWPFQMDHKYIEDLEEQLQLIMTLLSMESNAYNVEAIVGEDDKVYLLELGARSGGSLIPQVTEYATGINMVTWVIQAAVGDPIDLSMLKGKREMPIKGYWSNYMVHSDKTGKYQSISFDPDFENNHLVDFVNDLKVGDEVHRFRDAQDCIGEFILRYDSMEQMFEVINNIEKYINIKVK
uniref:Carbamoyl-phosphate-synthetase n=1 Tax=uncultured Prevotella sp. TaxID=159272 RepID=A0A6G8F1J9_9BACT|nr:carbamoyl-phosphate-synthetase [uncultured Prevotella sp.]